MKKRIKYLSLMLTTALILLSASSIIAQTLSVTLTPSNYNSFNISCFGAKDGSITTAVTGGTPPYSYTWSNGDQAANISNLASGFYSVRVMDAASNSIDAEITLEQPEPFKMEVSLYTYPNGYNISLFNACNGSVTVSMYNGVTPITYQWSDGSTTQNRTNLCARNYGVVAIDDNGCKVASEKIYLTEPQRMDWQNIGNANTTPGTHFLGTTDNVDFVFKTNSIERARIKSSGEFNISSLSGTGYNIVMADPNGKLIRTGSISGIPECHLPWEMCGNYIGFIPNAFVGTNDNYDLVFKTNANGGGGENMRIKTNGKVGIGTTTPSQKLEVAHNDGAGIAGGMLLNNLSSANKNSEIKFNQGSTNLWSIGNDVAHNNSQNFFIYDNLTNSGWGATRFFIDANGKVGINTTTPSKSLEVSHDESNGGMALNRLNATTFKNQISFQQNGVEKWAVGVDKDQNNNDNFYIWHGSSGSAKFYINNIGNVGIGNTNPSEKLEVSGKGKFSDVQATSLSGNAGKLIQLDANGNFQASSVSTTTASLWNNTGTTVYYNSGKVFIGMSSCIGCTDPSYNLYVQGGIAARDVKVTATNFPDYVFAKNYRRMSLYELEQYIKINNRLPEMPSAKEVEKNNGYELGTVVTLLVKQNEEQALYLIEQQKQIDELKAQIKNLERRK